MRRKARKKHVQLTLDSAIKYAGRGGPRPGSGRPKGRKTVSHDARPEFAARYPLHVTLRIAPGVESLGREHVMKVLRKVIRAAHKPNFRIVEFNVLTNHVHLVVEASGAAALAHGIQGFAVRVARRVNKLCGRTGKLFATRYHMRVLKTPREVRNVLRYVLLNRKHHAADKKFSAQWIDPYSSAAWFTGWAAAIRADTDWKRELVKVEAPNARPTVWLLTTGWWEHHGRLRFDEVPS
jgi:REP element-mobilizing transposase RayT